MRIPARLLAATACVALAAPAFAQAPQRPPAQQQAPRPQPAPAPQQQTPQAQAPAPAKPYTAVAIKTAAPSTDASFAAFRKQLGDVAAKKDRAGLGKLVVAKDFFWESETGDKADKKKSGLDNLGAAVGGFTGAEASGWETLVAAAGEPTLEPFADKKGVMCSPANPTFDEQTFEQVIQATGTEIGEWGFPVAEGVEVRASGAANAPVIDKLAMALVRVMTDEQAPPDAAFVRVVTPAGKTGFVPVDSVASLVFDQLCYVKDASGWKIAGYIGGE